MWCCKCDRELRDCTCADLTERLRNATDGQYVAIKWCVACDKNYHSCRCATPDFKMRRGGQIHPLPPQNREQ